MTFRLPSLNALRAFEAAARNLSFAMAAQELGVTAGAISQQVRKLEESLGVALFRRLPSGLLLTHAGEAYFPKVRKVFADLTDATEEIAPDINSKKFDVGLSEEAAAILPPDWPGRESPLYRHVRQIIQTNDVDLIRTNHLDCLIRVRGGSYRDLASVRILLATPSARPNSSLDFICRPGLVDCRQSQAILEDLMERAGERQ